MNNPMQMIFQMLQGGQNPQQILQQLMASNDPKVMQAVQQFNMAQQQMQQNGMSMQQYAQQYARQNNIDINQVMRSLGMH